MSPTGPSTETAAGQNSAEEANAAPNPRTLVDALRAFQSAYDATNKEQHAQSAGIRRWTIAIVAGVSVEVIRLRVAAPECNSSD